MNSKLTKGLQILFEMEKSCYIMDNGIELLEQEISRLGRAKRYAAPVRKNAQLDFFTGIGATMTICAIACGIIGIIMGLCAGGRWWENLFSAVGNGIIGLIYGALGGIAIGIIVTIVLYSREKSKYEAEYQQSCEKIKRLEKKDAQRVQVENKKKEILKKQCSDLRVKLNDTYEDLNTYYRHIGIDNKYRSLIPMFYMYEFARLGIADTLEGSTGLNKLVHDELNIKQLQNILLDISYKLDEILDKQDRIYDVMLDINGNCRSILQNTIKEAEVSARNNTLLAQAVENTSLSAYYSQLSYEQQLYHNFMLAY